jgi:dihydrodipicolinate synthase/N-acetylneuraminate lyase
MRDLPTFARERIRAGTVIPAMPLALDADRRYDERRQRALVRYYVDAGAGGLAVGVHTTQFEIRDPRHGLFEPVLASVSRMIDEAAAARGRPMVKIGGVCGRTPQALAEADYLVRKGYHAGLLSLAALKGDSVDALIAHAREVSRIIPLIGFYLQPDVGGRILPYEFWRAFAGIDEVLAIKMAPFNRYRTLDVVRGVCDAGREGEIALYTGNDDNIVIDLLTEYRIVSGSREKRTREKRTREKRTREKRTREKRVRIVGGLLGQWCVWTKKAVELHATLRELARSGGPIPASTLTLAQELTDANAAIFDAAHGFSGCIPGIHEILRRQGLLAGTWCLNPDEVLSPGQAEEIDRVCEAYPHLTDDDFVRSHIAEWMG